MATGKGILSYPQLILLYPLKRLAYTALLEGLLLLYARPRFPFDGGGAEDVYWYKSSLLGPPHISALFPLHFILQSALPSGAGPPPFTTALPHPE
jgi:hypothetical protein